MVIHGRNEPMRRAIFSFLWSIGLQPVEWRKAIQWTGKPSPSISEIVDAAFAHAVVVVVLLTPDDEVRLLRPFRKSSDPAYERRLVGQARPNVLFEAGMAMAHHADSTVLVQVGSVKPFSDIAGRHVTRLTNSPESRSEFVTKLGNAGLDTDTSGTAWYTEGNFDVDGGTGGEGEAAS
jgi:predicted nucleotide-binding protein